MNDLKLKQLRHEINTWKRMLGFMQEENVHLKNRLSEVLKDKFNENMLDGVEFFQTNFIKEDELISLLKNELIKLENILFNELVILERNDVSIDNKIEIMRENINSAERNFTGVNNDFNKYLAKNI